MKLKTPCLQVVGSTISKLWNIFLCPYITVITLKDRVISFITSLINLHFYKINKLYILNVVQTFFFLWIGKFLAISILYEDFVFKPLVDCYFVVNFKNHSCCARKTLLTFLVGYECSKIRFFLRGSFSSTVRINNSNVTHFVSKLSTSNIDGFARLALTYVLFKQGHNRGQKPLLSRIIFYLFIFQSVSAFFLLGDPAELSTDLINLVKICACGNNNKQTSK